MEQGGLKDHPDVMDSQDLLVHEVTPVHQACLVTLELKDPKVQGVVQDQEVFSLFRVTLLSKYTGFHLKRVGTQIAFFAFQ